jgi:hypothetical protein
MREKAKKQPGASRHIAKTPPVRTAAAAKSPPRPSGGLPGTGNSGERMCWRFGFVDEAGPWGFDTVSSGSELCEILGHLRSIETMTVGEVFPGGRSYPGKDYTISSIPNSEAHSRLDEIGLADMTKISVLRLSGEKRLYGFRHDGNIFHIVWWDPGHQIWPSLKKNT